jgi:hypothetical protein
MTTLSLSQFAHEVGRSRDTVTRAIATLGLTVPKPPPGKPTQISPSVQDALRQHFRAYPQVQPEPQIVQHLDPRLMTALERIYKNNLQAHKSIQTQVSALEIHACVLKEEIADLTEMMTELRAAIAESRHIIHAPNVPKCPAGLAPMAIAAALLMAVAVWFFQQSPYSQADRITDPAHAEWFFQQSPYSQADRITDPAHAELYQ